MPGSEALSLSGRLRRNADLSERFLAAADATLPLSGLPGVSRIENAAGSLAGRSVLLWTKRQSAAAAALIELDGLARRIVLCPPDLAPEHLPHVARTAEVDTCVCDSIVSEDGLSDLSHLRISLADPAVCAPDRGRPVRTEWALLTSGTTGVPKLVLHSLESLTAAISPSAVSSTRPIWSTFYDIRRFGGLQIFLRAILTGSTLVLSDAAESTSDFLHRLAAHSVTHLSGTPSHWRRALMSPEATVISPRYLRLSGEIADTAILSQLRATYCDAKIAHAFASTEAGVAFEVEDGLAGIPAEVFTKPGPVELKIEDDSLQIRSNRVGERYLGRTDKPLKDTDGFVDTGDMVELRGDRYHFAGRRDGVINVGGAKVHPEEVEAVINRHPVVRMSMVRARKSPITGAVIVADVVLKQQDEPDREINGRSLQTDILLFCREVLASHKVPAAVKIVSSLPVAETGKLLRRRA